MSENDNNNDREIKFIRLTSEIPSDVFYRLFPNAKRYPVALDKDNNPSESEQVEIDKLLKEIEPTEPPIDSNE